jgi:hypothetical protein
VMDVRGIKVQWMGLFSFGVLFYFRSCFLFFRCFSLYDLSEKGLNEKGGICYGWGANPNPGLRTWVECGTMILR